MGGVKEEGIIEDAISDMGFRNRAGKLHDVMQQLEYYLNPATGPCRPYEDPEILVGTEKWIASALY